MGVNINLWPSYLSSWIPVTLDSRHLSWPECIQAIAATVLLTEESRKITFGGSLVISTPHQVRMILNQKVGRWLTDSRILKYEAILLEKDDLT
jgi:hypothetical protein